MEEYHLKNEEKRPFPHIFMCQRAPNMMPHAAKTHGFGKNCLFACFQAGSMEKA